MSQDITLRGSADDNASALLGLGKQGSSSTGSKLGAGRSSKASGVHKASKTISNMKLALGMERSAGVRIRPSLLVRRVGLTAKFAACQGLKAAPSLTCIGASDYIGMIQRTSISVCNGNAH